MRMALESCFRLRAAGWLLLVALAALSSAQLVPGTCQTLETAPLSQCHSIVDYPVFVPLTLTIAAIDQAAAARTGAFRLGLTSVECTDDAMRFICSEAFRPCLTIPGPNNTVIALPSQTCRGRCEKFVQSCASSLETFGSPIPDCLSTNPANGIPNFPESSTFVPLGPGRNLTLPCNSPTPVGEWSELPRATCHGLLTPADTPLCKCHLVIDYPVYIPEGFTMAQLDGRASVSNGLARTNSVSEECADSMMRFVCAEAFRRCEYATVNPALPDVLLPSSTCYGNCWHFRADCGAQLAELTAQGKIDATPVNCEVANPQLGNQPRFPPADTQYYFAAADVTASIPCSHPDALGEYYLSRCEPFAGFPEECRNIVTWPVLIPTGSSQEKLAALARISISRTQTLPSSCQEKTLRMACASVFVRCDRQPLTPAAGINLPSFVCRSLCEEARAQCSKVSMAEIDCDLVGPAGFPTFPEEGTVILANGVELFAPCHVPEYTPDGYPERDSCPHPLVFTDDDEFVCGTGCPRETFRPWMYILHNVLTTLFAYLGVIFGTIAFVSLSLHPLKRTFPKNIINFQVLAATFMVIGFLVPHWAYGDGPIYRNTWCTDNHTVATGAHAPCAVQSFFLMIFNFSLVAWYCVVALFMVRAVLNIRIPRKLNLPLQVLLHIICWGIPLVIWIVLMATDSISSVGIFPCWADADKWDRYLPEVVFWYPVTSMLMFGLFLTAFSTIYTLKKTGRRGLRKQVRLILYLGYNFCANIWISFYHYYVFARRYDFTDQTAEWSVCSATSVYECMQRGGLEYSLYLIQGIVYSSQALCLALILLSDREIWYWWRDAFRRHILRQEIDDRAEALKRVRAVQAKLEGSRAKGSSGTSAGGSNSQQGWGLDD